MNRAQEKDRQAKSLVRLLKLWGYRNDVPIRSLYLEMRAAKRVLDSPPVIFYWDLHAIFTDILALPAMNDPSKYDGRRIEPCASAWDLTRAKQATVHAAAWAQLGAEAERDEDFTSAEYYWRALFAAL